MNRLLINKLKKIGFIKLLFSPLLTVVRSFYKYKNRNIIYYNKLFSNVKEGSMIVEIKGITGSFEIDTRSHILQRILIRKDYEPEIVSLVEKNIQVNKDAINIGANIGIFAVLLSDLIDKECKTLAIEPTPLAFKFLIKNIIRNEQDKKTITFNGVCSDQAEETILNVVEGNEEYSSIGDSQHFLNLKQNVLKIKVSGETIDNLVVKYNLNPGLILMDVEGAEMKVLRGAAVILNKYKPVIITELDDNLLFKQKSSSKEVIDFIRNIGYEIKDVKSTNKIKYPFTGNIIATANT